jgi:hypothetical protein
MNKKDILKIIKQVYGTTKIHESALYHLTQIVHLSTAVEREACAKVCDDMESEYWNSPEDQNNFTPADCGQAIRERRQ